MIRGGSFLYYISALRLNESLFVGPNTVKYNGNEFICLRTRMVQPQKAKFTTIPNVSG